MRATATPQERLTVQCRDGVPVVFCRPARTRGAAVLGGPRWYRVRAVVASWSEATPWWRVRSASLRTSGDRTVWRVEARPMREPSRGAGGDSGRSDSRRSDSGRDRAGIEVFDLVEPPDGPWLLVRAHD